MTFRGLKNKLNSKKLVEKIHFQNLPLWMYIELEENKIVSCFGSF